MKDIAEKLRDLEKTISEEEGRFDLFALFLREDAPDVWDLVVAADWIEKDRSRALTEISKRVRKALRPEEITKISRVVLVDKANPALKAVAMVVNAEHKLVEVKSSTFFGLPIRHGFIITSHLPKAA